MMASFIPGILLLSIFSFKNGASDNIVSYKEEGKYDTLNSYTNPVGNITNIGDPYVLRYNSKYYLYATSADNGFKVWESDNMADWEAKGRALDRDHEGNNWGKGNFWAPEVKYISGKFYMTYSAISENGMKIRIASSADPTGPFVNWSEPLFNSDNFSYIDGSLLIDGNNIYLYFVKDCSVNIIKNKHVSQIYVVKLSNDLLSADGQAVLCTSPDQAWEDINGDYQWNEGPSVFKHGDLYYLLYSSNYYASINYSVGYATAVNPMGPWTKYPNNPILYKNEALKVSGPGHCCITASPDSTEFFIVYHTHTFFDAPSGNRNVCIDRISFENGILKVIGPTRSPQKLPGGCGPRISIEK
jgi:GH43 family beta-xylosidase